MEKYPWEIGTRLANEIQARDISAAQKTLEAIFEYFAKKQPQKSFDQDKFRILQILTLSGRAALSSGARPEKLYDVSLVLVDDIISAETFQQLGKIGRKYIRALISLVHDEDYLKKSRVNLAIEYIRAHSFRNVSRKEVAEYLDCSVSYLSRSFKEITGYPFKTAVLNGRIDKAQQVLRNTRESIINVALDLGFADPNYFTAAFRRITGITPKQYRKLHTRNC